MPIYLGIDPGAKGSLCFLDTETKRVKFLPTPCLSHPVASLIKSINKFDQYGIAAVGIEDVHAMHGTAAGSSFKFGFNVGLLHGMLAAVPIGFELVKPLEWQRAIKAPTKKKAGGTTGLKKAIAAIALRLYPDAGILGPKGGLLDGRADALMIAHSLYIKYGGGTP